MHHRARSPRSGFTLLEVLISATLIVVILLGALNIIARDTALSKEVLHTANVEQLAQEMLYQIEQTLEDAHGNEPIAVMTSDLAAGVTSFLTVDSTLGFPPRGMLLINRGTDKEERVAYSSTDAGQVSFIGLERAQQCTTAASHLSGTELMWGGLAEPLNLQGVPPASLWDGQVRLMGETRFFRGDGTGFCFRVPIDPTGGIDFVDGNSVNWGSEIYGASTLSGWMTLYFEARTTYSEAENGVDLNRDGDQVDTFDIGQIRRRSWDASAPTGEAEDFGMGPTAVIQEQCNWGGDLDGDAFDDPMFFWDKDRRQLSIRLFLLGSLSGQTVVRRVETLMFLRNEFEG